ncbi:hypothetical protein AVEN_205211-1 [Araneus ventricosus]|uniref:Histone-lysine N-methyltransferase SETMAR n=1 Tax=Araneus ventricosus TaxID=182803 RepID=A0A4Y2T5V5_ARAVE|nr:hypothetical protein AVEN_149971-1 [Araneus ventricosus]GBN94779.1 hypothetical protein AVEN_205211-1 [Araneus ventricosus]
MLLPSLSCLVLFASDKQNLGLWKTIKAAVSCPSLRPLRRAILTSGVVLIHDKAHPYNPVVTQQLLGQFKWDVSDHPAYSPDLAPSDYHPFSELKNWLGRQSFQKNEIQRNVKAHLTSHGPPI